MVPSKRLGRQKKFVGSQQSSLTGRKKLQEGGKVVCFAENNCRKPTKWFDWQKKLVGTKQSGLSGRKVVWTWSRGLLERKKFSFYCYRKCFSLTI